MSQIKRETIKISDITNDRNLVIDDLPGFILLEQDPVSWDSEKGFADYKCILQRRTDDKFFAVTYTEYGCGQDDLYESELEEVFPVTKTIVVYE